MKQNIVVQTSLQTSENRFYCTFIGFLPGMPFLVVFSFFEKTTYCCRTRRLSVRLSVRPSVRPSVRLSVRPSVCPSVRPSVEIISFRGNSLPNRPIELKIGLNVREGVVHVRKAWFFEILIASCKFMQFAIFCK